MDAANPPTLYKADGCPQCNYQGYKGRTGIYELVDIDDTMRDMIHDGEGEHAMEIYARKSTPSIREDGIEQVLAGRTTLDEVIRVTKES
jgi:general secretion pathway protein E